MNLGELIKKKGADVKTVSGESSIDKAIGIMNSERIGALIVQDSSGKVKGIITERDILKHYDKISAKSMVTDFMTDAGRLVSLSTKDSLQTALKTFTENRVRHLPIMEDGKLSGILSIGDAVKELLDAVETENKYLKEYIMGQELTY